MKKILGIIILLILWQVGSTMTSPLFVPSPASVWEALIGLIETDQLIPGLIYSFNRISTATLLATGIAVPG